MSLNQEERAWMDRRDELTSDEASLVDECLRDVLTNGDVYEIPLATDDRAAHLESAMIRYVIESRKPS